MVKEREMMEDFAKVEPAGAPGLDPKRFGVSELMHV